MKMLGLNPMEQEIVDLTNTISKNGLIYFPDFCRIVLKGWRSQDEELFRQNMFKVLRKEWQSSYPEFLQIFCGTEPFPELYRAKKYKLNDHFFTKKDFVDIMHSLPVQVIKKNRYA